MINFRQPFQGDYPITLDYGEKFPPLYTDESPHRGIDYGCPMQTSILASEEGTVTTIRNLTEGYGKYVIVTHADGYSTLYAHLSEIWVRYGEKVCKGQVVGLSGSTGNSTGPHLHFEVRKNGIQIDPKTVLQNVFDNNPNNNTPEPVKPKFDTVWRGECVVVADVVNVRCHCDMSRVIDQLHKGDTICIGSNTTEYMGLPFRDFWDGKHQCFLRIAEHDPDVQLIRNTEVK